VADPNLELRGVGEGGGGIALPALSAIVTPVISSFYPK